MILVFHIVIALLSVVYSSLLFIAPSKRNFSISYALIGLTLLSGTYLVVSTHSPLVSSCEAGLVYLVIVSAGLVFAQKKILATSQASNRHK
jgi:predicted tellurium resistance membrane protein TerC